MGKEPSLPGFEPPPPPQGALWDALPDLRRPAAGKRLADWLLIARGSIGTIRDALPVPAEWTAEVGVRWNRALRRLYPQDTAKRLILLYHDIGITLHHSTVESWLAGQAPNSRHLSAALWAVNQMAGPERAAAFAAGLFAPPGSVWALRTRLTAELAAIHAQLARFGEAG